MLHRFQSQGLFVATIEQHLQKKNYEKDSHSHSKCTSPSYSDPSTFHLSMLVHLAHSFRFLTKGNAFGRSFLVKNPMLLSCNQRFERQAYRDR